MLFVTTVAIPFFWMVAIVPYLPENEPPSRLEKVDAIYFELLPVLEYPIFCVALALTMLVLSFVCINLKPRLAKVGLILFAASWLLAIILPALHPAREKPVIYLYPETEVTVKVRLHYDGELTHTYPKYPDDGWDVLAKPSGELVDLKTGRTHYCLFWEGVDEHAYSLSTGFVVEGANTIPFLEESLSKLGLSEREANEFIIYWLPRMENNRFNVVHFATEEYNRRVPLEIVPAPDTLIRVFMVFRGCDAPIEIEAQSLNRVERHGFTVVEWGGTELR